MKSITLFFCHSIDTISHCITGIKVFDGDINASMETRNSKISKWSGITVDSPCKKPRDAFEKALEGIRQGVRRRDPVLRAGVA